MRNYGYGVSYLPTVLDTPINGIKRDRKGCRKYGALNNKVTIYGIEGNRIGSVCIEPPPVLFMLADVYVKDSAWNAMELRKYLPEGADRGYWMFVIRWKKVDPETGEEWEDSVNLFAYAADYNKYDPAFPKCFREVLMKRIDDG